MKPVKIETVVFTILCWIGFAVATHWVPPSNGWWIGLFIYLGIICPIHGFWGNWKSYCIWSKYDKIGLKEGYIPLYYYLGGLNGEPAKYRADYGLALVTEAAFVFCRCTKKMGLSPATIDWTELKEIRQVPFADVIHIEMIENDADEVRKKKSEDYISDELFNLTVGALLGAKSHTIRFPAIVAFQFWDGVQEQCACFGVAQGTEGDPTKLITPLLPGIIGGALKFGMLAGNYLAIQDQDFPEVALAKSTTVLLLQPVVESRGAAPGD